MTKQKIVPWKPISILTLLCGLFAIGCSTDFEIERSGQDIPIVYGLIDVQDTAHYIRVERAFLTGGSDAAVVAQNIDSLYYPPSVSVRLEKVNSGQQYDLERVDGAAEGYPRRDGPFATQPNILYKIRADELNLQGDETIRLLIERGGNLPLVTAETTILSSIDLVDNLPADPLSLGNYLSTRRIAWRTESDAEIFDLRMIMHIRESRPDNPNILDDRTLEWVLSSAFRREDDGLQVNFSFPVEDFFLFINGSLEPLAAGRREFIDLDIRVTGGGPEFAELLTISQANVGITSGSDEIPIYSNLSEGRGIFASRTSDLRTGLTLSSVALDSLSNGIYTKNLGF
ncbi:MAG: hypothetical protein R2824_07220 [Saprospiraceae bacterium]|nr:DUF4249 family protein [Lewinella sp.]